MTLLLCVLFTFCHWSACVLVVMTSFPPLATAASQAPGPGVRLWGAGRVVSSTCEVPRHHERAGPGDERASCRQWGRGLWTRLPWPASSPGAGGNARPAGSRLSKGRAPSLPALSGPVRRTPFCGFPVEKTPGDSGRMEKTARVSGAAGRHAVWMGNVHLQREGRRAPHPRWLPTGRLPWGHMCLPCALEMPLRNRTRTAPSRRWACVVVGVSRVSTGLSSWPSSCVLSQR